MLLADDTVSNSNTTLVFPTDPGLKQLSGKRILLAFGPPHPKSHDGHSVLVDPDGEVVMLAAFRGFRVKLKAWVEPLILAIAVALSTAAWMVVTGSGRNTNAAGAVALAVVQALAFCVRLFTPALPE